MKRYQYSLVIALALSALPTAANDLDKLFNIVRQAQAVVGKLPKSKPEAPPDRAPVRSIVESVPKSTSAPPTEQGPAPGTQTPMQATASEQNPPPQPSAAPMAQTQPAPARAQTEPVQVAQAQTSGLPLESSVRCAWHTDHTDSFGRVTKRTCSGVFRGEGVEVQLSDAQLARNAAITAKLVDTQTADNKFKWNNQQITDFVGFIGKSCNDPNAYASIKAELSRVATGPDAVANWLLYPKRNAYQKTITDVAAIEAYYPNACQRAERMNQCKSGTELTAEQACDCAAGYPGDVQTGVGAGEIVALTNRSISLRACRIAIDRAQGLTRARYVAQLGRAQLFDAGGTANGANTLKEAIAAGYRRAEVDIARARLRDVEDGGAPTDELKPALLHLAAARMAGARDTQAVLQSITEVALIKKWNVIASDFLTELMKAPPPGEKGRCGYKTQDDCDLQELIHRNQKERVQ